MGLPEVSYEAVVLKNDESMYELQKTIRTQILDERELMERNQAFYTCAALSGDVSRCAALCTRSTKEGRGVRIR